MAQTDMARTDMAQTALRMIMMRSSHPCSFPTSLGSSPYFAAFAAGNYPRRFGGGQICGQIGCFCSRHERSDVWDPAYTPGYRAHPGDLTLPVNAAACLTT
jgi:hypothetical protein